MTEALIAAATEARQFAHAPFSGFQVGAALLAENGRIITGCNVESASYGLTICAERVAIAKGVSEGCPCFTAVAVVTAAKQLTAPCGACRQLLWEFAPDATVFLANLSGDRRQVTVRELIPDAFDRTSLESTSSASG